MAEVYALVVAGGRGLRFGADHPKQYQALAGRTVLEYAVQPFLDHLAVIDVTVVIAEDDRRFAGLSGIHGRRLHTAVGGPERAHSVLNGLHTLSARGVSDAALVLVHDGARPCVSEDEIDALLGLEEGILVVPESDALKRTRATDDVILVQGSVERVGVLRALTPQCFRLGRLSDALSAAIGGDRLPADEAQAIEWAGGEVRAVMGRNGNLKITTTDDLVMAEAMLAARGVPRIS